MAERLERIRGAVRHMKQQTADSRVLDDMEWLITEADRLQTIIAKLPKCWRLVNGQLVQDVLIVAGMTAWYLTALAPQGIRESAVRSYECRIDGWWVWFTEQNYRRPEDCYSSRESAETAVDMKGGDDAETDPS